LQKLLTAGAKVKLNQILCTCNIISTMEITLENIQQAAKQQSLRDRLVLAHSLLEDLDEGTEDAETEIEMLWLDEVERRIEAYRRGLITSSPFEEVVARVRATISELKFALLLLLRSSLLRQLPITN
jgi:hypothetical protein